MNFPEKFEKEMIRILGEVGFEEYKSCFAKDAIRALRVNTLKIAPEEFKKLTGWNLEEIPWTRNGFYCHEKLVPSRHPYYHAGMYYIQEPSAMTPAQFLPIEEGDKVLDMCAAPGGKSTELAARLDGTGILFSNDISFSRCKALLKNIELFGIKNAIIMSEKPNDLEDRFQGYFDKILIDAPCSGEGMFRKDGKMIDAWLEHGPDYFAPIQRSILESGIKMLRPGGMLLYSTCTFSVKEDEETVDYILKKYPEMSVVDTIDPGYFEKGRPDLLENPAEGISKTRRLFPHKIRGEGHYLALLQKAEDAVSSSNKVELAISKDKIPGECIDFLKSMGIDYKSVKDRVKLFDDKAVLLPEGCPKLDHLRVIRSGVYLGDCKKGRFVPSQAAAMTIKKGEFNNELHLNLEDERLCRYLKGETLTLRDKDGVKDGTVLVFVGDQPLGFGKAGKGTLKNKYLVGWRMNG